MNVMKKVLMAVAMVAIIATGSLAAQAKAVSPLRLWVYDTGRIDVLTKLGKDFEAKYKIPVEISLVDMAQIKSQFLLASGGADCADLAIIPHDNLGPYVENGAILPVNLSAAKLNNFLAPAVKALKYNGKLYGLPLSVENIGFFRNTKLVPKAPATWEEMISVGDKLMKAGTTTAIMGFPDATYNVYPVYTSFAGDIFAEKADGSLDPAKLTIADAGFVKGLELLAAMAKAKQAPSTIDWDGSHVLFESGKAPFIMTGPWALDRFKKAGVSYEITPFPAASKGGKAGAPFLGVQGMIISSASKQAAIAQAFATEFLASEANMKALYNADSRPSAWKTVNALANDKDSKGFAAAGMEAVPMPSIPAMGEVWDAWVNAAALTFSGEKTAKDALLGAKAQIEAKLAAKK